MLYILCMMHCVDNSEVSLDPDVSKLRPATLFSRLLNHFIVYTCISSGILSTLVHGASLEDQVIANYVWLGHLRNSYIRGRVSRYPFNSPNQCMYNQMQLLQCFLRLCLVSCQHKVASLGVGSTQFINCKIIGILKQATLTSVCL